MAKADYVFKLKRLLEQAAAIIPAEEFCGFGVVVYTSLIRMPILPLCLDASVPDGTSIVEKIAACSYASRRCHDGFHLVSTAWEFTHRNQYFAPFPNQKLQKITYKGNVGARFMTAKLGSLHESVLCTGVASDSDGLLVFLEGETV